MQNEHTKPTEATLADLIAQLVPPPVPEAISLWPQTALAKTMFTVLLVLVFFLTWKAYRHYRRNAYRRAALSALENAANDPGVIASILRRTALAVYPREQVAGLTGNHWLEFLNRQYSGTEFNGDLGEALLRGAYRSCPRNPRLTQAAKNWVRRHRSQIVPPRKSRPEGSEVPP
ncbi:DUF4381 domain-containing protein [Microbulbifer sp. HZ11]|uniref:DUF4381 domain-containing protein n=1 Tax=Microbulbifer sp. HZ11 TaxID=1453501 RepID=UPI000689F437|nr:DUF4381 domain-containing protein [Microbulbifer sp. HZ11]